MLTVMFDCAAVWYFTQTSAVPPTVGAVVDAVFCLLRNVQAPARESVTAAVVAPDAAPSPTTNATSNALAGGENAAVVCALVHAAELARTAGVEASIAIAT